MVVIKDVVFRLVVYYKNKKIRSRTLEKLDAIWAITLYQLYVPLDFRCRPATSNPTTSVTVRFGPFNYSNVLLY